MSKYEQMPISVRLSSDELNFIKCISRAKNYTLSEVIRSFISQKMKELPVGETIANEHRFVRLESGQLVTSGVKWSDGSVTCATIIISPE